MRTASRVRPASRPRLRRPQEEDGSQPKPCPPCRPPLDLLPQYLYRCMCHKGTDLVAIPNDRAFSLELDDYEMRDVVVENIIEGSRLRSPFLHFSTKFKGAYHFYAMSAPRADSQRDPRSLIIRLDVHAMIRKGTLDWTKVLNLSNDDLWYKYLEGKVEYWGDYVARHQAHAQQLACRSREVLLLYRGTISLEDAEVMDPYTEEPICKFDAVMSQNYGLLEAVDALREERGQRAGSSRDAHVAKKSRSGSQPNLTSAPWHQRSGASVTRSPVRKSRSKSEVPPWQKYPKPTRPVPDVDLPPKPTRPVPDVDLPRSPAIPVKVSEPEVSSPAKVIKSQSPWSKNSSAANSLQVATFLCGCLFAFFHPSTSSTQALHPSTRFAQALHILHPLHPLPRPSPPPLPPGP